MSRKIQRGRNIVLILPVIPQNAPATVMPNLALIYWMFLTSGKVLNSLSLKRKMFAEKCNPIMHTIFSPLFLKYVNYFVSNIWERFKPDVPKEVSYKLVFAVYGKYDLLQKVIPPYFLILEVIGNSWGCESKKWAKINVFGLFEFLTRLI